MLCCTCLYCDWLIFSPQMVKVTSPSITEERGSVRASLRSKMEPIVTRSTSRQSAPGSPQSGSSNVSASLRSRSKSRSSTPVSQPKLPAALDSHNYAKSPILECTDTGSPNELTDDDERTDTDEEVEVLSVAATVNDENGEKMEIDRIQSQQLQTVKEDAVQIEIAVTDEKEGSITMPTTVATTDVTKPLTIQTRFGGSPAPSSESTDTASEMGSAFNSPVCSRFSSTQNSPNTSLKLEEAKRNLDLTVFNPISHKEEKTSLKPGGGTLIKTEVIEIKDEPGTSAMAPIPEKLIDSVALDKTELKKEAENAIGTTSLTDAKNKFTSAQGFTPKVSRFFSCIIHSCRLSNS